MRLRCVLERLFFLRLPPRIEEAVVPGITGGVDACILVFGEGDGGTATPWNEEDRPVVGGSVSPIDIATLEGNGLFTRTAGGGDGVFFTGIRTVFDGVPDNSGGFTTADFPALGEPAGDALPSAGLPRNSLTALAIFSANAPKNPPFCLRVLFRWRICLRVAIFYLIVPNI